MGESTKEVCLNLWGREPSLVPSAIRSTETLTWGLSWRLWHISAGQQKRVKMTRKAKWAGRAKGGAVSSCSGFLLPAASGALQVRSLCILVGPMAEKDIHLQLQDSFRAGVWQKATYLTAEVSWQQDFLCVRSSKQSPSSCDGIGHCVGSLRAPCPSLHPCGGSAPEITSGATAGASTAPDRGGVRAFCHHRLGLHTSSALFFPISKQGTRQKHLLQGDQRMTLNDFLACSKVSLSSACQSHRWCKGGQGPELSHQGMVLHPQCWTICLHLYWVSRNSSPNCYLQFICW